MITAQHRRVLHQLRKRVGREVTLEHFSDIPSTLDETQDPTAQRVLRLQDASARDPLDWATINDDDRFTHEPLLVRPYSEFELTGHMLHVRKLPVQFL